MAASANSSADTSALVALPSGLPNKSNSLTTQHVQGPGSQLLTVTTSNNNKKPEGYDAKFCLDVIEKHLPALNGQSAFGPVEFARITLIRQAAFKEDYFYLILHQCICLGALGFDSISSDMPNATEAFSIVDSMLAASSNLRPDLLLFFAKFPVRLSEVQTRWPHMYACEIDQISKFLVALRLKFHQFEQICKNARLPPMAHHISDVFGVSSPIFQQLLFTAILRNIWKGNDPYFERKTTDIFLHFQTQYLITKQAKYLGKTHHFNTAKAEWSFKEQFSNLWYRSGMASGFSAASRSLPQNLNPDQFQPANALSRKVTLSLLNPINSVASRESFPAHRLESSSEIGVASNSHHNLQSFQHQRNSTGLKDTQKPHDSVIPNLGHSTTYNLQNNNQLNNYRDSAILLPGQKTHAMFNSNFSQAHNTAMNLQRPSVQGRVVPSQTATCAAITSRPSSSKLIPRAGHLRPQRARTCPEITALHQAHLMSPAQAMGSTNTASSQKLYQQVVRHCMLPSKLETSRPTNTWSFTITSKENLSATKTHSSSSRTSEKDLQRCLAPKYRLRCSSKSLSVKESPTEEQSWIVSNNCWPAFLYVKINTHLLEFQRKLDHGKDIPVDISDFVHQGTNTVIAYFNIKRDATMKMDYYLFVEEIQTSSFASIRKSILAQRINSESFLFEVKRSRENNHSDNKYGEDNDENTSKRDIEDGDGDLVVLESSSTAISIFDPILPSRVFDIPVRGKYCLHRECFDLDTFLQSRPFTGRRCYCRNHHDLGRDHENEVETMKNTSNCPSCRLGDDNTSNCAEGMIVAISSIDSWRCPLCRRDARPKCLAVNEYLLDVRAQLARDDMLDTRTIQIDANGKWEALKRDDSVNKRKIGDITIIDADVSSDSEDSFPVIKNSRFRQERRDRSAKRTKETVIIDLSD